MALNEDKIKKIVRKTLRAHLNEVSYISNEGADFDNYGWCFILCGAPGSGKSYLIKHTLGVTGKVFDIDTYRERYRKYLEKQGQKIANFRSLQNASGEKMRKQEKAFLAAQNKDRLGNIIFDITGRPAKRGESQNLFEEILEMVKPAGYKVAVCWCVANRSVSMLRNVMRGSDKTSGRQIIPDKSFHQATNKVNKFVPTFLQSEVSGNFDKAFIYFSTSDGLHAKTKEEEKNSVIELQKQGNIFTIPEDVVKRITDTLGPQEKSNNWSPETYMTLSDVAKMIRDKQLNKDNFLNENSIMDNKAYEFAHKMYDELDEAIEILFGVKEKIELYTEQNESTTLIDKLYDQVNKGIDTLTALI